MLTFSEHTLKKETHESKGLYQIIITSDDISTMRNIADLLDECIEKKSITILTLPVKLGETVFVLHQNKIYSAIINRIIQDTIEEVWFEIKYKNSNASELPTVFKDKDFGNMIFTNDNDAYKKLNNEVKHHEHM